MKKSSIFECMKGLKRVGKTWKTKKNLEVRKLTGQMKIVHFWFSWTRSNSEPALLFGNTGKVTRGCSSEKTWTLAWYLDLSSWQSPCSRRARCPGVFGQKIDNEIQGHMTTILQSIPEEEFQKCFEQYKHRLTKCICAQGDYFEGDSNH
jgi:hypothetical protein